MKKMYLLIIMLVVTLSSSSTLVNAAEITDDVSYHDKKIVFFGDSITYGVGVTTHESRFGDIVANSLGFDEYLNMGVRGSTIAERVGENDSFLERASSIPNDADYVVVLGGVNDWIQNVPIADFTADIATMITNIETAAPNATIVLMTPYKVTRYGVVSSTPNTEGAVLGDYVDIMIAAANQDGDTTPQISLIDLYSIIGFDASDNGVDMNKYTLDGLHTNIAGNERIANILLSYFDGTNLMASAEWYNGFYVKDGVLTESTYYGYSSYVPVEAGKSYVFYNEKSTYEPLGTQGQFHDGNKDYVSSFPADNLFRYQVITVPDGVEFVIINAQSNPENQNKVFLREIVNYEIFNITFNVNGGEAVTTQLVETGEKVAQPFDPVKSGASFIAWYTDEDFTTLYDFDNPVTDDLTLYAKWAPLATGGTGSILAPTETVEIFGLAWYWWGLGGIGLYWFFFTDSGKKTQKKFGLK